MLRFALLAGLASAQRCMWMQERNWNDCFEPHTHWGKSDIVECTKERAGWSYGANEWDVGNLVGKPVVSDTWWNHGCKTPNQSYNFENKGRWTCKCGSDVDDMIDEADKSEDGCEWMQFKTWNECFEPHTHWDKSDVVTCNAEYHGWAYSANQWDLGNIKGNPVSSDTWWNHGCKTMSQSPSFADGGLHLCWCADKTKDDPEAYMMKLKNKEKKSWDKAGWDKGADKGCQWLQQRNYNECFEPHTHWNFVRDGSASIAKCSKDVNGFSFASNQWDIGNVRGDPIDSPTWWSHGCKRMSQSTLFEDGGLWTCKCDGMPDAEVPEKMDDPKEFESTWRKDAEDGCKWEQDKTFNECFEPHTHWTRIDDGSAQIAKCSPKINGYAFSSNQWDIGHVRGEVITSEEWLTHGCKKMSQSTDFVDGGKWTCTCAGYPIAEVDEETKPEPNSSPSKFPGSVADDGCGWVQDKEYDECFEPHTHWDKVDIATCSKKIKGHSFQANFWDLGNVEGEVVTSGTWYNHGCKKTSQSPSFQFGGLWTCQCGKDSTPVDGDCKDLTKECSQWAKQGYCTDEYEEYMQINCRVACGLCKADDKGDKDDDTPSGDVPAGGFASFKDFKDYCEGSKDEASCENCLGKWKGKSCKAPKNAKKVRCKKLSMALCDAVKCDNVKDKKCKGKSKLK